MTVGIIILVFFQIQQMKHYIIIHEKKYSHFILVRNFFLDIIFFQETTTILKSLL